VSSLVALLIALPASLLPAAWRARMPQGLPMAAGTVITGAAQVLAAFVAGAWAFPRFAAGLMAQASEVAAAAPVDGRAVAMIQGAAVWFAFLTSPLGLALLGCEVEGLIRLAGAATTGEPLGTLPLWLLEHAGSRLRRWRDLRRLPPLVPDEVLREGDGLRIASCRRRPWDKLITIEIEDRFYRVVGHETLPAGPRPHVYRLAPLAPGAIIRGLHRYRRGELPAP
jgi:hypothetical protein